MHLAGRRTAAVVLAGVALLVGVLSLSVNSGAQQSVADSSWGGIAPTTPSPSPTETPIVATANDSSWGG